jgi:hypothetical protein
MTNGISDFGTLLYSASISGSTIGAYSQVGEVVKIGFGELKVKTVNLTSQSSTNGYTELRPSGAKEISESEITCNFISASGLNVWKSDIDAQTIKSYKMIFGTSASLVFPGFCTSMKISAADAQSPNSLTYDLKLQPTGDATIS